MNKIIPAITILLMLFLGSCSVVKKNGYYQSRKYNGQVVKLRVKKRQKQEKNNDVHLAMKEFDNSRMEVKRLKPLSKVKDKIHPLSALLLETKIDPEIGQTAPDSCDVITLMNGDEITAKVEEIGLDVIKYKRCDNLTGPVIVIKKEDVFMIRYVNGTKDVIHQRESDTKITEESKPETSESGNEGGSNAFGWVIWIIGLFITLFVSWFVGAIMMLIGLILVLAL